MKVENDWREELRQGYCSFPLHFLSRRDSHLVRGEGKILQMMLFYFYGGANEDMYF